MAIDRVDSLAIKDATITAADLAPHAAANNLVSGTDIKTINGTSIVGSGDYVTPMISQSKLFFFGSL